jgi:endoglucanase
MKPLLNRYRFLLLQILASTALGLIVLPAHANCLDQERLTGVNLAGAEFNARKIPGQVFTDYTYPSNAELDYIAKQGANIIRFPFLWERLQPQANGPLDTAELGRLRTTVQNANARGLCVLLDVHNYARYKGVKLNATLPDGTSVSSAFTAFWLALAAEFPDPTTTIFGLMNEPAAISVVDWAVIAKQTLAALRKAKATNMVFVAGGRWSGVHDWFAGLQNSNAT